MGRTVKTPAANERIGAGRPSLVADEPTVKMTIRLPMNQKDFLIREAKKEGMTLSQYARKLIDSATTSA